MIYLSMQLFLTINSSTMKSITNYSLFTNLNKLNSFRLSLLRLNIPTKYSAHIAKNESLKWSLLIKINNL